VALVAEETEIYQEWVEQEQPIVVEAVEAVEALQIMQAVTAVQDLWQLDTQTLMD
jgi:hypothetical protein